MNIFPNEAGYQPRVLLLGGTSEIGLAILAALQLPASAEVILAGRDEQRLAAAGKELPAQVRTVPYDATQPEGHQAFVDGLFAEGPGGPGPAATGGQASSVVPPGADRAEGHLDLVISAAGVLVPQADLERDVRRAAEMIETNFTGHVSTLLAVAARMRAQGRGTIVVLSSVAAVRPRKANPVYGSAKAGLDAFARGLADLLHGTGVRVLLVRPGFVTGRMTAGMPPAPLATTPEAVGKATAAALRHGQATVWVPPSLAGLALALKFVPRPIWRRISR
jgi:decaprenylphospho-beta-D-erythro-pentofuranosid-2-ulose 2-reductase